MRAITALAIGILVPWSGWGNVLGQGDDPGKKNSVAPEVITVRVKAAKDGSVLDVEFETRAQGTVIRTPTGLIRYYTERVEGQPMITVDWEKVVGDGLAKLRKDQGLGEQSDVRVAPDDDLNFGAAVAVVACCRKAGFKRVEFADSEPNKVVIVVGPDGNLNVDGKAVALEGVKSSLAEKAAGGADKLAVAIRVHPQVKYAAVSRLLREFKESGYRNIETVAQEAGAPK
jgi:biopolymer transport protein ExbD